MRPPAEHATPQSSPAPPDQGASSHAAEADPPRPTCARACSSGPTAERSLIDEVGDLDLSLQPKLLRAIERFEIRRIGGDKWKRVDVRILAATRRDLDREVQAGRFRDDLFHCLAVARIELPALRNPIGDVAVLAAHFWRKMGGDPRAIPPALMQKWAATWRAPAAASGIGRRYFQKLKARSKKLLVGGGRDRASSAARVQRLL